MAFENQRVITTTSRLIVLFQHIRQKQKGVGNADPFLF
jgi:hypothetical protein